MSPGAKLFFKDAPWGSVEGQSLADFVQWEDLDDFNALRPKRSTPLNEHHGDRSACGPVLPSSCTTPGSHEIKLGRIRLLHFNAQDRLDEGGAFRHRLSSSTGSCPSDLDMVSDVETQIPRVESCNSAFKIPRVESCNSAFRFDPLLEPVNMPGMREVCCTVSLLFT